MTDKAMPERINVHMITDSGTFPDNMRVTECSTGAMLPSNLIEAEYIRADLVQGDANEPLADGQFRWAKRYKIKCIWVMTRVVIDVDGTPFLISHDGLSRKASGYAIIGPVIRPPEDV